jgi:hypothetical protein
MARLYSGRHDPANLRDGLRIDRNLPAHECGSQFLQCRGHGATGSGNALALHHNEVDTHVESRGLTSTSYGMIERIAISHQSGRREHAISVRFDDSFVHVARESEIVGVKDELDREWHFQYAVSPTQGPARTARDSGGTLWAAFGIGTCGR